MALLRAIRIGDAMVWPEIDKGSEEVFRFRCCTCGESRMSTSVGWVVADRSFGRAAWTRRRSRFRTVARFATCFETTTAARLTVLCPGVATSCSNASRFRAPVRSKRRMSRSVWRRRLVGSMRWGCYWTLTRFRPLRRRRVSTARPLGVEMRARKPCTRACRRFFGWYVRFGIEVLS